MSKGEEEKVSEENVDKKKQENRKSWLIKCKEKIAAN